MESIQWKPFKFILFALLITWVGWGFNAYQSNIGFAAGRYLNGIASSMAGFSPMIVSLILLRKHLLKGKFLLHFFIGLPKNIARYIMVILLFTLSLLVYILFRQQPQIAAIGLFLNTFMTQCIFGGGLEEIGWRGYLQPALEKRISIVLAAIAIGLIWSLWHLPLWVLPGTYQEGTSFILYTAHTVITALSLAAVYKLTGSVLLCILYHGWTNTLFMCIPFTMSSAYWFVHGLEGVIAVFICQTLFLKEKRNIDMQSKYNA